MATASESTGTVEEGRAVIEDIARRKGTFTDAFKQEAEEEARSGRMGMLQAVEGGEENRVDLNEALKMYELYLNRMYLE